MKKLALVVMTILISTSAFAHHGGSHLLENVRLQTESHNWELDIQCKKNLHPNTVVQVKTRPKQIRLDGRVIIQQDKKTQSCRVRQLVVKLN